MDTMDENTAMSVLVTAAQSEIYRLLKIKISTGSDTVKLDSQKGIAEIKEALTVLGYDWESTL
ncbi:MAG: hypothetical protein O2797_02520 [Bacteroidetes bacterium]|nr:hypothetical protein [Bacteroidota bacterium]